jgi:hypothetical protein
MLAFLKRIVSRYGFFHRSVKVYAPTEQWQEHPFFSESNALNINRRLALIVQKRNALKDELAKAIKQKKARAPIYAKLRALSVEELRVVSGR